LYLLSAFSLKPFAVFALSFQPLALLKEIYDFYSELPPYNISKCYIYNYSSSNLIRQIVITASSSIFSKLYPLIH
jgi:hypothetical protein